MEIPKEWHRTFFKNPFYNPASRPALAAAPAEAAFVLARLKLKKGSALLDLCCGPGRHAVEFAKRGMAVTGYDFSKEYLKEAAGRAKGKHVSIRLVRGDMRRLGFTREFDAAVNLFTSFGYFRRFSDDIKTLKGAARALKPGGLFLIDVVHGDFARANLKRRDWALLGRSYHLEETAADADGIYSTWTEIPAGGGRPVSKSFFTRLYNKERLSAALKKSGFKPLKFWGNFRGAPLSEKSDRLICLAKKIQ